MKFFILFITLILVVSCTSLEQKDKYNANSQSLNIEQEKNKLENQKFKVDFKVTQNASLDLPIKFEDSHIEALNAQLLNAFDDGLGAWEKYYNLAIKYNRKDYYLQSLELSFNLNKYPQAQEIAQKWYDQGSQNIDSKIALLKSSYLNQDYDYFFKLLGDFSQQDSFEKEQNYFFANLLQLVLSSRSEDLDFNYLASKFKKLENDFPKIEIFKYISILYTNQVESSPSNLLIKFKTNAQLIHKNEQIINNLINLKPNIKDFYLNYYVLDFAKLSFGTGNIQLFIDFIETNFKTTDLRFLTQVNVLNFYIKALLFEYSDKNINILKTLINRYIDFIETNFWHNFGLLDQIITIINAYDYRSAKQKLIAYLKRILPSINSTQYQYRVYDLLFNLQEYNYILSEIRYLKYQNRSFEILRLALMIKSTIAITDYDLNQAIQIIQKQNLTSKELQDIIFDIAFFLTGQMKYKKHIQLVDWHVEKNFQTEVSNTQLFQFTKAISQMYDPKTYNQALSTLEKLNSLLPNNPDYMNSLGYSLLESGDKNLDRIFVLLKKSFDLSPNIANIDSLGWYYFNIQDYNKATLFLEYSYYSSRFSSYENEIALHLLELYLKTKKFNKAEKILNILQNKAKKYQNKKNIKRLIQKYNYKSSL